MDVASMRSMLIQRYSSVIRGQRVENMPTGQVIAIYRSLVERKDLDTCRPRIPKKDRLHEPVKYEQLQMEI